MFRVWGLLNIIEGDMEGVQVFNGINVTGGYTDGYKVMTFVNNDKNVRGGRIVAFVNYADELDGLDIGCCKYIKKSEGYPDRSFSTMQRFSMVSKLDF